MTQEKFGYIPSTGQLSVMMGPVMPIRRFRPEQVVTPLRQIEVEIANAKSTPQACKSLVSLTWWG